MCGRNEEWMVRENRWVYGRMGKEGGLMEEGGWVGVRMGEKEEWVGKEMGQRRMGVGVSNQSRNTSNVHIPMR